MAFYEDPLEIPEPDQAQVGENQPRAHHQDYHS